MHPQLIALYNEELQHLRRETDEFAAECGAAAAMLALDQKRVPDPYVERLLEGVAYLAARTRLKLDSQYPIFTQQLLDVLFPGWLSPSPPACVLRMSPDWKDPKLAEGPILRRRQTLVIGESTSVSGVRCEFETARDLQLWPLQLRSVRYIATAPAVSPPAAPARPASTLRVELLLHGPLDLAALPLDAMPFFVDLKKRQETGLLMELVAGRCQGVALSTEDDRPVHWLSPDDVRHLGFGADEALFPIPTRGHAGARALREFAALPEKFDFFEVSGLRDGLRKLAGRHLVLTFHFSVADRALESLVRDDALALYCVPAVNLRRRELNLVQVPPGQVEYPVRAASGPARWEVVQVERVTGGSSGFERSFAPVFDYASRGAFNTSSFYALRRERRRRRPDEGGPPAAERSRIDGDAACRERTDLFISLSEGAAGPHGADLKYLAVTALCMDRDAAAGLRHGGRYSLEAVCPVDAVACVAGPSDALDYPAGGQAPWQVISHLFVNHLSLKDASEGEGADALRAMLGLYAPAPGHFLADDAKALSGVRTSQVTRRLPGRGELAFGRGIAIRVRVDRTALSGGSPFMLGAMLDHHLASHVAVNSFAEMSLESGDGRPPLTWRRAPGTRPTC